MCFPVGQKAMSGQAIEEQSQAPGSADDGWTRVTARPRMSKKAAAPSTSDDSVQPCDAEARVLRHDNLHCVRTVPGLGGAAMMTAIDRVARGSRLVAFQRRMYAADGSPLDWHLVVMPQRVAQSLRREIEQSGDAGELLAIEPFLLESEDFADRSCERDDTLYLPIPSWLSASAARKHIHSLLAPVHGYDLLDAKQYKLIIPEADGCPNTHRGKCFLKCILRRVSTDARPGPPVWVTVSPSRLPFVRALLHDCAWPDPPKDYAGDEDPAHVAMICRWAHRHSAPLQTHASGAGDANDKKKNCCVALV
jgi:hypothetical protein